MRFHDDFREITRPPELRCTAWPHPPFRWREASSLARDASPRSAGVVATYRSPESACSTRVFQIGISSPPTACCAVAPPLCSSCAQRQCAAALRGTRHKNVVNRGFLVRRNIAHDIFDTARTPPARRRRRGGQLQHTHRSRLTHACKTPGRGAGSRGTGIAASPAATAAIDSAVAKAAAAAAMACESSSLPLRPPPRRCRCYFRIPDSGRRCARTDARKARA